MTSLIQCRCCGVPVDGMRAQVRVCTICDQCDGLHGDKLQIALSHHFHAGRITWGQALCRAMIDDALITGRIVFVPCPNGGGAHIDIPDPPQRWQVVAARAVARNEMPDLNLMIEVILARHIPGVCTRARLDAIAAELTGALQVVDPNILEVVVDSKRDTLDPQHLIIEVRAKTAEIGAVTDLSRGVEIPADIMLRSRGQA